MDGMVDENGTPVTDPLAPSPDPPIIVSSVGLSSSSSADSPTQPSHLVTATNIVHLTLPTHASAQVHRTLYCTMDKVQSVIQPNQQSVIQTATNLQQLQCKGNVILLGKPNSVIQTAQGSLQTLQVVETASDDSCYSEDESPKKRRDLLTRRPSYRKILNELGGGEIADNRAAVAAAASAATTVGGRTSGGHIATTATPIGTTSRRHLITNNHGATTMVFTTKMEQTSEGDSELDEGDGSLSSLAHAIPYHTVIPAGAIQISSGEGGQGIHTLTMTNSGASGAIVQYAQGQEFFVPVVAQTGSLSSGGGSGGGDGESRKQLRLLKNREAARECRRKKKEYIKCLENRVAVLENQNKALIDELKTLKELYCQQKVE